MMNNTFDSVFDSVNQHEDEFGKWVKASLVQRAMEQMRDRLRRAETEAGLTLWAGECGDLAAAIDDHLAQVVELQQHREALARLTTKLIGLGVFKIVHEGGTDAAWKNIEASITQPEEPLRVTPHSLNSARIILENRKKARG